MSGSEVTFEKRLSELDISLFSHILSQSYEGDRKSWLAIQRQVRQPHGYVYLEIGSYRGGSLQQHIVDPLCQKIYSIDLRPTVTADDAKVEFTYEQISTADMVNALRKIDAVGANKITTFEMDAKSIDVAKIDLKPDYCFIDGEHTQTAVLSDFNFCFKVCDPKAIISFHDDWNIYRGIAAVIDQLQQNQVKFTAWKLPGVTFAIILGENAAWSDPFLREHAIEGVAWVRAKQRRARLKSLVPGPVWSMAKWLTGRSKSSA